MKQRVITATILMLIFLPLLIVEELFTFFQVMMLILSIVASFEMVKMYEKEKKFPIGVKWIIIVSSALVYMSTLAEWATYASGIDGSVASQTLELVNLKLGFLPMLLLVVIVLFSCMVFCHGFDGADLGKALTAILYTGCGFGSLTILRFLGLRYIVYLFMITILTDMFAYFVGVKFGKHKMCPLISPHKTWEGAVGGTGIAVVCATAFAFCYGNIFKGDYFNADNLSTLFSGYGVFWKGSIDNIPKALQFISILAVSIFISIAGTIGDLVASKLKRTYGIKDYGNIFPGHGGVLDRLDSAIFAALALLMIFVIL